MLAIHAWYDDIGMKNSDFFRTIYLICRNKDNIKNDKDWESEKWRKDKFTFDELWTNTSHKDRKYLKMFDT